MSDIHPNTPKMLIREFKRCKNKYHILAEKLEINVSYVYNLIKMGIGPTDRTSKGRNIRLKLHLSKYKKKVIDYSKIPMRRISKMSQKELLWRLENRK